MKRKFLEDLGLENEAIEKIMAENGKDIQAEQGKTAKAEGERDTLKTQLDTANKTLEGFDGKDAATIRQEIETYKQKAENAERDYNEKLAQRDFEDALKGELESVKFSSVAAKTAVMSEVREAGLKLKDGKIMGLSDLLSQIRERDASAFVDEEQEELKTNKARFTGKLHNESGGKKYTRQEIMEIKDPVERQAAIQDNIELFTRSE